jgi:hypothetical protein
VSCWPSHGDRHRPSPRLPPSPNDEHPIGAHEKEGALVTVHAEDMVLVPRAELDALRAENRRLRREAGDREALKRIRSDSGEGRTFTREGLAEAWGISE